MSLNGVLPLLRRPFLIVCGLIMIASASFAQKTSGSSSVPPPAPPPPPRAPTDSFDQNRLRYGTKDGSALPTNATSDACLLPPLSLVHMQTVTVSNLKIPARSKKEYEDACNAIRDHKFDSAEKHLRKAVQDVKYPAALVTLGQVLIAQQQLAAGRSACTEASQADSSFVPAYLCLADVAARSQNWKESLEFSNKALEIDSTTDHVAYSYNALANLNLRMFSESEKSSLRAVDIDKNHSDPRIHFLLAQIYEGKGETAKEVAQLREYLKFVTDPDDARMVKESLAQLESQSAK